jgi:hypothetical protein
MFIALNIKFKAPPAKNANGKINATIAIAVLNPLSFIIINKFAMHGTNKVIVTRLTSI